MEHICFLLYFLRFSMFKKNIYILKLIFYFNFSAESRPMMKRLKTTDVHNESNDNSNEDEASHNEETQTKKGEIFKHVKESKEGDTETLDAATNVSKIFNKILIFTGITF